MVSSVILRKVESERYQNLTLRKLEKERDQLGVVVDQVKTRAYAIDLTGILLNIMESGSQAYGSYHCINEGVTSWNDFGRAVFTIGEIKVKLKRILGLTYLTKVARAAFSKLDKMQIKKAFEVKIRNWCDNLIKCIHELNKTT